MREILPPASTSATGAAFASFGHRAAAMLIDVAPLYVLGLILTSIMPGFGGLLWICGCIAYFTYFIGGKWQATPGKRVMGIHVMRADGAAVAHSYALARCFAYIASWIIIGLGFVLAAFTAERTALHDLLCDTRVVYGKR